MKKTTKTNLQKDKKVYIDMKGNELELTDKEFNEMVGNSSLKLKSAQKQEILKPETHKINGDD